MLIFFASLFGGFVQGQTPEDITVDGDYTDWSSDSLMATDSSGVDFRLTWNETMLFLGWDGTDWKSTFEGADLFVYLNTSEGVRFSHEIGVLPCTSRLRPTMPSSSKMTPISNTSPTTEVRGRTRHTTLVELYAGWADNKVTELALPGRRWVNPPRLICWSTLNGKTRATSGRPSRCRTPPTTTAPKPSLTPGMQRTSPTSPRPNNFPSLNPWAWRRSTTP